MKPTGPADELERHGAAVATLRAFAAASAAQRALAIIDRGNERSELVVEWQDGTVQLTAGDRSWTLAPDAVLGAPALALPDLRPPPASAVHVDRAAGELHAPIGAIGNLADALLGLAVALGGRSVACAEWATDDPDVPLGLAARAGDPVVVTLGEEQFELPLGWGHPRP